tara:strand:+ start:774 stop:977 length:204 start_codon:yes stop_codon:yes gene_type:complete
MAWYESKRHRISHTDTYFLKEEHTRWGHNWTTNGNDYCKIMVLKVLEDDERYKSAVKNSAIEDAKVS